MIGQCINFLWAKESAKLTGTYSLNIIFLKNIMGINYTGLYPILPKNMDGGMSGLKKDANLFEINDKPLELMNERERDNYWLERTGEHYHEPTPEEKTTSLKGSI